MRDSNHWEVPPVPTDEALRAWAVPYEDDVKYYFPPYFDSDHDHLIMAMATELMELRTRTGTGNPLTGTPFTRTFPDGSLHRYDIGGEEIDAHGNYIEEDE